MINNECFQSRNTLNVEKLGNTLEELCDKIAKESFGKNGTISVGWMAPKTILPSFRLYLPTPVYIMLYGNGEKRIVNKELFDNNKDKIVFEFHFHNEIEPISRQIVSTNYTLFLKIDQ